jgi:hypothetical protein
MAVEAIEECGLDNIKGRAKNEAHESPRAEALTQALSTEVSFYLFISRCRPEYSLSSTAHSTVSMGVPNCVDLRLEAVQGTTWETRSPPGIIND